jgi:hypothetical protein
MKLWRNHRHLTQYRRIWYSTCNDVLVGDNLS